MESCFNAGDLGYNYAVRLLYDCYTTVIPYLFLTCTLSLYSSIIIHGLCNAMQRHSVSQVATETKPEQTMAQRGVNYPVCTTAGNPSILASTVKISDFAVRHPSTFLQQ